MIHTYHHLQKISGNRTIDWNHANVTPVYKKGDTHHPANYRPISLTCISCKLLEHVMASNMMEHLESNNILYEMQHGFRSNRSCESQIISLAHQLAQNNDKNIQTDLIIMDFAKAFDKVPHKRLISTLNFYSISDQITIWISSFLANRTKTVLLENTTSEKIAVTSGGGRSYNPTVR
jgi:retron-type reverse transcriptase